MNDFATLLDVGLGALITESEHLLRSDSKVPKSLSGIRRRGQ